jgi:hypothetical protein
MSSKFVFVDDFWKTDCQVNAIVLRFKINSKTVIVVFIYYLSHLKAQFPMMLNMQLTGNAINPEKTKYYIKYNNAWNTRLSTVFYE